MATQANSLRVAGIINLLNKYAQKLQKKLVPGDSLVGEKIGLAAFATTLTSKAAAEAPAGGGRHSIPFVSQSFAQLQQAQLMSRWAPRSENAYCNSCVAPTHALLRLGSCAWA